jgi:hypothetical protein
MTCDRPLYFPSEGRRAGDFFALKNPTASAGFEPANLGTKGQHASSRPPKPLSRDITTQKFVKVQVQAQVRVQVQVQVSKSICLSSTLVVRTVLV